MKLFLHWLRYDLRRFRLMLGAWTLLVAAYAGFLGWLHVNILTVGWQVLDWSKPMAITLGLLELGFLFALFNSDPAEGPRHFWKTRPPSGRAVAGVKLLIAVGFFVAMPLLAWGLVSTFCVIPGYVVTKSPVGLSWTGFLFWSQSLTISAFALAAACAGSGTALSLRLLVPVGTVILMACLTGGILDYFADFSRLGVLLERWFRRGLGSLFMAGAALAVCSFFLLRARRRPLPVNAGLHFLILIPAALILIAALIHQKPVIHTRDESLPSAALSIAENIRIAEPPWPVSHFRGWAYYFLDGRPRVPEFLEFPGVGHHYLEFYTTLKINGLPPDTLVSARWLSLRLTASGGAFLDADAQLSMPPPDKDHEFSAAEAAELRPCPAVFPKKQNPFPAVARCTATGTLRLILHTPQSQAFPFLDGRLHSTRIGLLRQQAMPPRRYRTAGKVPQEGLTFLDFAVLDPGWAPPTTFSAESEKEKISLPLDFRQGEYDTGFLVSHRRAQGSVWLPPAGRAEELDNFQRRLSWTASATDWRLDLKWHEPASVVDIPVVLHDIIPWTGHRGNRALLEALSTVHPAENPSASKVRSDLRYALGLVSKLSLPEVRDQALSKDGGRALPLWKAILAEVPHGQLPVLLEFCEDEPNGPFSKLRLSEILRQRIGELLQPADIPAILANPALAAKLRSLLPDSALPPASPSAPGNPSPGSSGAEPAPAPASKPDR
ncbi:MAG: hypothetical protein V4726_03725 [Verrucomicrobiota bacterium]